MATIQTLAIDTLKMRGLGNEFNGFDRIFKTLDDANSAVSSGDYNPTEGAG